MRVRLFRGDCLEVMARLGESSVDAIVTDPPYCAGAVSEAQRTQAKGQGIRSENMRRFGWMVGDNMTTAGLTWALRMMAWAAVRVVKPEGSMLVFCDWRMLPHLAPAIESAGLRYQGLVVWDKGSMGLGAGFRAQHELIMQFTFGAPQYHDQGTPNVLQARRVPPADRRHQTEKPVALMERLVAVVAPAGGLVLDPMMGSGSTGVAAVETGREFVGIERDPKSFRLAEARIRAVQPQLQLWEDPRPTC